MGRLHDEKVDKEVQLIAEYVAVWFGPHAILHCQICGSLVLPEPEAQRDRHADYHSYIRERFGHLSEHSDGRADDSGE